MEGVAADVKTEAEVAGVDPLGRRRVLRLDCKEEEFITPGHKNYFLDELPENIVRCRAKPVGR